MSATATRAGFDFATLKRALEQNDAETLIGLYAADAEMTVVDRTRPPSAPMRLVGRPAIEEFWRDVRVPGEGAELNQTLEHAGRLADFLELGELMCRDALHREESCGGHFRTEHQTPDGEALRDDDEFSYVAAWEFGEVPTLHSEDLTFEYVHPSTRSYK